MKCIKLVSNKTGGSNMITNYKDLVQRLDEMEAKYDKNFRVVFDAIRRLLNPPEKKKGKIGFKIKKNDTL